MKQIFFYLYVTLSFLLISSGCLKMGSDYHRPDVGILIPEAYQHAPFCEVISRPVKRWWHVFNNPELNQFVEEALWDNLDIKKVTARISEMRSYFVRARADRFPKLNLQGMGQRQRQPETVSIPGFSTDRETQNYNLSFPASFEFDLWGRLARAEESALADLLHAEENLKAVIQSVVAETIGLYLQMESLERRINITLESIENYRRSLDLVESRYGRGLTTILDLRQARRTLANAEASLPSLRQDLGTTQQKLAVLLGNYPKTRSFRPQPEGYFKHLSPVPQGLPSELLLSRPDIRSAEARLVALNAGVGLARASRFPRINLTGDFGYSSKELDQLFMPHSELWNLTSGIVQPLFDAGKLKADQQAAEARYKEGVAEYAQTVLTAFFEVENSLLTRKEQLKRRERVLNFLIEARATQAVAEDRYKRGLVAYLNVLEAQQTRFNAEDALVLVELAILSNRVSLHRALGGEWPDSTATGKTSFLKSMKGSAIRMKTGNI